MKKMVNPGRPAYQLFSTCTDASSVLKKNSHRHRWCSFSASVLVLVVLLIASYFPAVVLAKEPYVIAMSFTQGSRANQQGVRANAGVRSYIDRINAAGGVHGRLIQLESLEDGDSPKRHAENIRTLISEKGAVAIIGCAGDAICRASAAVASERGVPLIAPLSGVSEMSRAKNPFVFSVRADLLREAKVVAAQLIPMGSNRVAMLSESRLFEESEKVLRKEMESRGMVVNVFAVESGKPETLLAASSAIAAGGYYAVILNVGIQTVTDIINTESVAKANWPVSILTLANGNLPTLARGFKGRAIGYTEVVPNPEALSNLLSRELVADAEKHSGIAAISYDGLEAYIGVRLLVEALQKTSPNDGAKPRLFEVLDAMSNVAISGFRLNYKARQSGSDWVGTGFRARSGELRN